MLAILLAMFPGKPIDIKPPNVSPKSVVAEPPTAGLLTALFDKPNGGGGGDKRAVDMEFTAE